MKRVAAAILVMLVAWAVQAQNGKSQSWRDMAMDALRTGEVEKATQFYVKWTEADPTDAMSLYNLACCYSLLSRPDSAMNALTKAQQAGWSDSAHAADDSDLESLRARADFQKLLSEIARNARTRYGGYPMHTCEQRRVGQYLVVLPTDYDPNQRYPLVVLLHSYGSNPERFAEVTSFINTTDFIYAVPEAPYSVLDATGRTFSHLRERGNFHEDEGSARHTAEWIVSVADDMMKRYPIDGTRFSIIGFSQGAAMAHVTAAIFPERVTAYCAHGGYFVPQTITPERLAAEKTSGVRVLITHGKEDQAVSLDEGVYAYNLLKQAGVDVKLEILGGGHTFGPEVGRKVNEWLLALRQP
ncbi:dienelactone hydrolase family protein [bacterium]|nr:dienelactone hydrolase family protein [bacterium]MBU1984733.1 dienelactone hydrolase family protein [bacterium]